MADNSIKFLGFKQVTIDFWNALEESSKKHHLWFVREVDKNNNTVSGDIYFGTRHYGHFGSESEDIQALKDAIGDIDVLSGLTLVSATTIVEAIQELEEYIANNDYYEGVGITISDDRFISANAEATTTSDITIAGGAINASGLWTDDIIPSGTSVQDILLKLLCTELWPSAATKPTITAKVSGTAISGLKEVNSTVTVNAFSATTTNGNFNASYTNVTQPETNSEWSDVVYTTTKTGFTNYSVATSATSIDSQTSIIVAPGTNKVTVKIAGNYSAPTTTPISNLKNDATDEVYTYTASAATATTSVTVTGVYPIYVNGVSASTTDATAAALVEKSGETMVVRESEDSVATYKMPLVNTGTAFAVLFAKHVSAPYRILLPQGKYSLKSALAINGLTNKYETDQLALFVKNGTETIDVNGLSVTYDIYEYAASEGANCVKFTLQ